MTKETLETIILGHIAKELKDEIQIGRQVNLAKTIMQALRIHDVVGQSEQLKSFADWRDENEDWINHNCKDNNDVIKAYKQSL